MVSRLRHSPAVLAIIWLTLMAGKTGAQESAPVQPGAIRLLIDCSGAQCDQDFFRTEIAFVEHVRDRQNADVHLLITSETTGPGGRRITFSFYGQGRFAGRNLVLRHTVAVAESDDSVRREMVRLISLGLVPYAIESSSLDTLTVTSPTRAKPPAQAHADPWHYWTFRSGLGGNGSGERSNRFSNINGSFGANRTTEAMKLNLSINGSRTENRFELPDGGRFTSRNQSFGSTALFVRSLGRNWSTGVRGAISSSTFQNLDRSWYVTPVIEYDIFPYSESNRRLLTLQYSAGMRSFNYGSETVFGKLKERTKAQAASAALTLRQRWGTVGFGLDAASFLPALKYNHFSSDGDLSLNVAKGLSLNLAAEITSIHDQVYLPRGEATTEEVLVRRRQLATGYQYFYSFGISYTFGSIYSAVVNPRLDRGAF